MSMSFLSKGYQDMLASDSGADRYKYNKLYTHTLNLHVLPTTL